ncbi:MAG: hypothetical protein AAB293_04230 [Pseudomonadota bacterium]
MSLFDWLSGLFGSNGSEVNQNNENIIAQDVIESMDTTQNQSPDNLDVQIRDEREAEIQESSS